MIYNTHLKNPRSSKMSTEYTDTIANLTSQVNEIAGDPIPPPTAPGSTVKQVTTVPKKRLRWFVYIAIFLCVLVLLLITRPPMVTTSKVTVDETTKQLSRENFLNFMKLILWSGLLSLPVWTVMFMYIRK